MQGVATRAVEKFRAYGSYAAAFQDLAKVLSGQRYADALANAANPAAYAKSLQRSGYATDPQYADKLTRAIGLVGMHLAQAPAADRAQPARADRSQEIAATADKRDVPDAQATG